MSLRHWCHQCRKEVGLLGNDLKCASCGSEFLETIDEEQHPRNFVHRAFPTVRSEFESQQNAIPLFFAGNVTHPAPLNLPHVFQHFHNVLRQVANQNDPGTNQFEQLLHGFGISPNNIRDHPFGQQLEQVVNLLFQTAATQRAGVPPASQESIAKLSPIIIEQSTLEIFPDCSICKDEFNVEEVGIQLPCGHVFHSECITRWLEIHNQCPICRASLPL